MFNENGDVKSVEEINMNQFLFNWKKEFKYERGKLKEERYFKDGTLKYYRKISYLTNDLPELDIRRDDQTKKMTIVKFVYSSE